MRVPTNKDGMFKELKRKENDVAVRTRAETREFTQSTVFYVGRHMFHLKFPTVDAADDHVAVPAAAAPLVAAAAPVVPAPLVLPAPTAPLAAPKTSADHSNVVAMPKVAPALLPKLAAGTESRDGDADESKRAVRRFAVERRPSAVARTPAVESGPPAVPHAPRAHSSHSFEAPPRVEAAAAAAAVAVDDDVSSANSDTFDGEGLKSRSLVNEFSNDGPATAEAEIAVYNLPPFSSRATPSVPARRASTVAPAQAQAQQPPQQSPEPSPQAQVRAPAPVVEAAPDAMAMMPPPPMAVPVVVDEPLPAKRVAVAAGQKRARAPSSVSPVQVQRRVQRVVAKRAVVEPLPAPGGKARRIVDPNKSARELWRETRAVCKQLSSKPVAREDNENAAEPSRAAPRAAAAAPPPLATPVIYDAKRTPGAPKKAPAAELGVITKDVAEKLQLANNVSRETKLLVGVNHRLFPSSKKRTGAGARRSLIQLKR